MANADFVRRKRDFDHGSRSAQAAMPAAGLSRVEVIVVTVAVALGLVILIPRLTASRENARANYCAANLRRFDKGIAHHLELIGRLPSNWVMALLPELATDSDINLAKPGLAIFSYPRPATFTCPSHPNASETVPERQMSLYAMVVLDPGEGRNRRARWFFRDRERDAPIVDRDRWIVGRQLTPEQAEEQLRQPGPHAGGSYRQSNGKGEVRTVPTRGAGSSLYPRPGSPLAGR